MPAGMRAPTSPIGRPDVSYGLPGAGGLLTEWAESVPDLTWPESIRTYGRMRRDPKLTAVLSAFFLPILRANWVVDPAGVTNAKAVDLVSGDLGLPVLGHKGRVSDAGVPGFKWKEHVRLAMLRLVYGHMPFEQWYNPQGKDGLTHLAGLAERQPHTIAIIDIDDDGQIRAVEQNTQTKPIPANRLLWYVNEREGANWTGMSLLRSCYTPWVLKHEVLRVHATSHRRWGMGVPVVHAPPGGTPGQIEEARRLAAGMRAGDQAGAGLPDGYSFEIAGLSGSVPDAVAFLQFLNEEMTGSALAKVLELGSTASGSRALGDTFLDFFLLALQAAADAIGETATYGDPSMPGISRALTSFNFGDAEPCPRIIATDVGDRHEITATAIQQLIACGAIQPDDELEGFLREAWSLPARTTPRTVAPAPPGRAAPPAPAQGGEPPPGGAGPAQLPPAGRRPATEPPPPRPRPPSPAAADWDPGKHPRGWGGQWAHSGGETSRRAQDYIRKMTGKVTPRELGEYETPAYKRDVLDPAFTYTPAQAEAIHGYAERYQEINAAGRSGKGHPSADAISSAMQPMPEDLIVLREVTGKHALDDVQPGDVIADGGFSSATIRTGGRYASGRDDTTVMHILAPKGTPAVWADPVSEYPEDEIILDQRQPMAMMKKQVRASKSTVTDVWLLVLPKDVAA